MKRYEINDEVRDFLDFINADALRLVELTRHLILCKSENETYFKMIISTAETLGKEAEKLRQITYGKSEE